MLCNFLFLGLSTSFRFGEVEHLVKQLEVVVVDDGEVFGDIDIGNVKCAYVVEGFINITLTELHEIPGKRGEGVASLVELEFIDTNSLANRR